jgi:copper chaperone CopZ
MAMAVRGVKDAKYNRRSGKITVKYDANKTSVRSIKHAVN